MGGTTAATEVACVTREVAAYGANLSGPARAMAHRANAEMDRAADRDHGAEGVALVTPGDLYANRTVAIPEPVRAGLVDASDTLVQTASNACQPPPASSESPRTDLRDQGRSWPLLAVAHERGLRRWLRMHPCSLPVMQPQTRNDRQVAFTLLRGGKDER